MRSRVLAAADLDAARRILEKASPEDVAAVVEELGAEVVRLMRVDTRQALDVADRALLAAEIAGDPRLLARATWSRGHALSGVLRAREAADAYESAAAAYGRLGDAETAARVSIGHVNTLMYLAEYERALEIGERARRTLSRRGDAAACARLDMNLGNVHFRLERPAEALRCYDRALRFARRTKATEMIAPIQFNRANALTNLGKHDTATKLYREVEQEARAAGETRTVGFVAYSLGYLDLLRGEYGRAFDSLDSARAVFEELGDVHYVTLALADLAELFVEVNAFQRAKPLARRARVLATRHDIRYEAARCALLQAIASIGLSELGQAATFLEDASTAFRAEGNRAAGALVQVYLADLHARRGDPDAARAALTAASAVFEEENMPLRGAAALTRLAALEIDAGDSAAAARTLERARPLARRSPSPWLRARLDHLGGRLALEAGRAADAVRSLRRAVDRIENIRGRIGLDEFRVSFTEDKAPVYADLVRALLARGGRGAVAAAFEIVERSRSRALVDLLSGRVGGARERLPAAAGPLLEKLETLRGEVSWLSGFTPRMEGGDGRRDERRLARTTVEVRDREQRIADVMSRLRRLDAGFGALTCGETSTLPDVRERLAAHETLVEYYVSAEETLAFVVTRGDARVVRLPTDRARLVDSMTRLRFQLEKHGYGDAYVHARADVLRAALDHHLRSLAATLWEPLEVETERVIVVPHGPLHSLPFAALVRPDGTALLDHHEITFLPSASAGRLLDRRRLRPARNEPPRVLAVGVGDESIPRVEEEVDRVRRRFRRGRLLRAGRATRARFRAEAATADVVHVATHGVFREDDPHFSALRLADGWMSLYDLYGLELAADLVCLSACQSGRSWTGGGDELVGLARGFLHAGASTLVVSLWPVRDDSTARLMDTFYESLAGGARAETALRTAMRELRAERPDPYHWAPFVLIGRGGPVIPAKLLANGRTSGARRRRDPAGSRRSP
ncbi:MAG: CHAT domain-containing tetratricopeptide repeat protein [bacterium]